MTVLAQGLRWIAAEAASLGKRLEDVPSFASTIPMVGDALPEREAISVADDTVRRSRVSLAHAIRELREAAARRDANEESFGVLAKRLAVIRGRFDALLTTVDVFADALTQRAEHTVGALLRGLDLLARDGLRTTYRAYDPPPLVCYLDAGVGGAIRRAFTTLPDGEASWVALIKIPRERLFGVGLASLLHEVGHQGASLLDLGPAFEVALTAAARTHRISWSVAGWWGKKLSEVLPDAWALCKLGITATLGLVSVFNRSPGFVFHDDPNDPHPMPHVRVLLSAALGARIWPHARWRGLVSIWTALYPRESAPRTARTLLARVEPTVDQIADVLAGHRSRMLGGRTLAATLGAKTLDPDRLLRELPQIVTGLRSGTPVTTPCRAVAAIGLGAHVGSIAASDTHDLLRSAALSWARSVSLAVPQIPSMIEGRMQP